MNIMTSEITKLLDKLYNLRGEDSVILSKIDEERETAENIKSRTENEKEILQNRIKELTEEHRILSEEGDRFLLALSKIKGDDYKNVIDLLNIDFDPDELNKEVEYLLPKTIKRVEKDMGESKDELLRAEQEMNDAIIKIEELSLSRKDALSNQLRLNNLFELAINGNSNITRESVSSLLKNFDFSEEEQRETAKLLMFPEDALLEYEKRMNKTNDNKKRVNKEELVTNKIDDKKSITMESEINNKKEMSSKDKLIDLLAFLGFDYLDFTTSDIDNILENFDEDLLKENVIYAKGKDIGLDIFSENAKLFYDKEFKEKIDRLISVGKMASDIYLYPNILTKYNKIDLDGVINKFENSGLDPKMVPLIAY